jgi:hypothetical protein
MYINKNILNIYWIIYLLYKLKLLSIYININKNILNICCGGRFYWHISLILVRITWTMSHVSVVCIATGYGPWRPRDLSSNPSTIQTGSAVYPTSYLLGTGGSFSGGKSAGREANRSPATSTELKKTSIYTSPQQYTFMA